MKVEIFTREDNKSDESPSSLCGLLNQPSSDSTELPSLRLSSVLHALCEFNQSKTLCPQQSEMRLKMKNNEFLIAFCQ